MISIFRKGAAAAADPPSGPAPVGQAKATGDAARPRTAVFIAGDKNIFFPAVVAMRSVQVHNPGRFDYFLSFDEADFTDRMREITDRYDINFLNSRGIDRANRAFDLDKMEGFWPVEINLNWLLPEHLHGFGYAYSIKLDYDILCVGAYDDLDRYWPRDVAYAAVHIKAREWPDEIPGHLNRDLNLDLAKTLYSNAGFIVFNNAICRQESFYDKFENAHHFLIDNAPDVALREQAALAIVSAGFGGIADIPTRYNHRIPRFRREAGGGPPLVNIHYIGEQKPWRPLEYGIAEALVGRGRGILLFFFPVWLEFAASVEGFTEFCEVRPYTAMDVLGLARGVINEAEQLFRNQRREVKRLREAVTRLGGDCGPPDAEERSPEID